MVVCKYYRQGNCRYGQHCQFEHINNFGGNSKGDSYEDEIAAIAKEVLFAERGGQWLLSCFGPWQEGPCIPGMEDLSPEEVRWEMYHSQKNGMIEQAKLHFQQLCQDMKAKRDALKNPNRETIAMLKKIVATVHKNILNASGNTAGKPSNFAFATPQLRLPSSTSASNVFGNKTFGTQSSPFSGSFTTPTSNPSVFGWSNNTSNPIFGGTPTFGNNLGGFGTAPTNSSVFGGTTNTSTFNTVQNTQGFGQVAPQTNSVFGGGTTQSVFRQPNAFAGSPQMNNVFGRPQTSQTTTSVFDSGATPATSLFSSPITSQSNSPLFGTAKTSVANPFAGSSNMQNTNPVFGTPASSGSFTSAIFSQPKTLPAFSNALPFGGQNFANNPGSIFGGQPAFGTSAAPTNSIFGSPSTTTSTFVSSGQMTNTFEIPASAATASIFGVAQNTGPVMSAANSTPFGSTTPTSSSPFVTTASQFNTTSTTATPFSRPPFGLPAGTTGETYATTVTSSSAPFGSPNTGVTFGTANTTNSPFTTSTFGDLKNSPFASTNTTVTTTTTNPFAPRAQHTNSPFGNVGQPSNTVTVPSSGPFGKSPFGSTVTTAIIDDSVYTVEGQLTDDEKSFYLAEKFIFGKIPLKPPTKDIR